MTTKKRPRLKAREGVTFASEREDDGIPSEAFKPKNVKIRVTTMISEDILEWLKKQAEERSTAYQTLLNDYLREAMEHRAKAAAMMEEFQKNKALLGHVEESFDGLAALISAAGGRRR